MQTTQIISFLLIFSVWTISCFPSKPLNERSTELTWQAWLLIDESQNKQQQDSTLRRRITPKSVFIAPTFSPDSLPECSEGYQSDSMGRCIKIIMLNKELHLDFLLQQLNQKFGGIEDYDDEEITTTGPLNINIPLNGDVQEETDAAIVVAPTNNFLQEVSETKIPVNEEKVNVKDIAGILGLKQAEEVETTTITGALATNTDSTTQGTTKNFETTTMPITTSELDALFFLDPKRQIEIKTDATTTFETTEATKTTTEMSTETTDDSLREIDTDLPLLQMDQALPYSETMFVPFSDTKRDVSKFDLETTTETTMATSITLKPTTNIPDEYKFNKIHHQESSSAVEKVGELTTTTNPPPIGLTPIDNSLTSDINKITNHLGSTESSTKSLFSVGFQKPNYDDLNNKSNTMKMFSSTNSEESSKKSEVNSIENTTILKTTPEMSTMSTQELPSTTTSENSKITNKFRFPETTFRFVRFPSEKSTTPDNEYTINSSKQLEDLFNRYIHTRGSELSEREYQITTSSSIPVDISSTLYQRFKVHRENHRNRDKNSEWFHLPTKWSDTSQKPVVLRFSRKHGYIDSQQLGSNNFYREIDPRMFGFPTKSRIQR